MIVPEDNQSRPRLANIYDNRILENAQKLMFLSVFDLLVIKINGRMEQ